MRIWVFRIILIFTIPILIITAEMSLRLFGFGHRSEFTVPCTINGGSSFCDNDRFTWQFFPPGAFRLPPAFAISTNKPSTTYRIFIVGESAAQGDPDPSYSFGRYLEVMLRESFPTMDFEIVNTAITAVNSHVLLPATRDLARRKGDLFIFYIGNNEVVGPYGTGTVLTRQGGASLALIRAGIFLNSTRLGQLLGTALRSSTTDNHAKEWRGMEMFLEQQVPADSHALARVYENFRDNLRDIVAEARESTAHVLVSTIPINLKDSAPFASLHRTDLSVEDRKTWEELLQQGVASEKLGKRPDEVLTHYLKAAAIDDHHAELNYRIGRSYLRLGDYFAAEKWFSRARDLDTLRFRADTQINEIIRSVVADMGPGVELVDTEQLFADANTHGVPGRDLFYDHVHMNARGNYLIAQALFPRVVALLPEEVRSHARSLETPTQETAERLLAFTSFDKLRVTRIIMEILSQPPFTARLNNDEELELFRREVVESQELLPEAAAAYGWAIDRAPDDRWLQLNYGLLLRTQDPAAAAKVFHRALELLPGNYVARERLADALNAIGNYNEAITQCHELLRRMPYHPTAYLIMAYAKARLGRFDESIAAYERAIELNHGHALDAYTNIGIIQLHQGRFDHAVASFKKAIAVDINDVRTAALFKHLNYALQKLDRDQDTVKMTEKKLSSD